MSTSLVLQVSIYIPVTGFGFFCTSQGKFLPTHFFMMLSFSVSVHLAFLSIIYKTRKVVKKYFNFCFLGKVFHFNLYMWGSLNAVFWVDRFFVWLFFFLGFFFFFFLI